MSNGPHVFVKFNTREVEWVMGLKTYRAKRKFEQTPEPAGKVHARGRSRFVVQEHHASRLHYDFRLEMGGVLKSWAIPKGPSLNPRDRRLAVQVEDHPVEYLTFTGHIDEGNYGAGDVYIWDHGRYALIGEEDGLRALEDGRLKFQLEGDKLQGEFNLIQMKDRPDQWLLIKARDQHAQANWQLEQVHGERANGRGTAKGTQRGRSSRKAPKHTPKTPSRAAKPTKAARKRATTRSKPASPDGQPAPFPGFIAPMLATLVDRPFSDSEWLFETKWDGVRALAYLEGGRLRLVSRNEKDMTARYPELAGLPEAVRARQAVLDGEIVALDEAGVSSFQRLQSRVGLKDAHEIGRLARSQPVSYRLFDLLYRDGRDLRGLPLLMRKARLREIIPASERLGFSDHIRTDGLRAFAEAQKSGLEGIIAKHAASPYVSGRAGNWLKIKTELRQEVVIGGYTDPRRTRPLLGALVVGLYRGDELVYVGHVGGGFDHAGLEQVHALLQPLRTDAAPFAQPPPTNEAVHWVRPTLVAEVKLAQWTSDHIMRQPIFLGLRDDKDPRQCVLEEPRSAAQQVAAVEARQGEAHAGEANVARRAERRTAAAGGNGIAPPAGPAETADRVFARRTLRGDRRVKAGRDTVDVTSLDRVYWPDEGYTKADLLRYEWQVSSHKLPYLAGRPLILKRHPSGIAGPSFFQHDVNAAPGFVRTVRLESETGREIDYVIADTPATLLYMANLGAIAQNPWHSRVGKLDCPDWVVFDLDPGKGVAFGSICDLALAVKDMLDRLGLEGCAKTSGSRGLHIYVPLRPVHAYEAVAPFAEGVAARVVAENPSLATLERSLDKRPAGTIYVDHLQNARGKSMAAPYSVRSQPGATVSTPLTWREVKRHVDPHDYTIKTVPRRLGRVGDLFAPALSKKQGLARARQRLARLQSLEA